MRPSSVPPPKNRRHAVILSLLLLSLPLAAHADKMRLLDDPVQAAQVHVDLLQQARKSVRAQYFIVGNDPLTNAGLALAEDAARRGCDVRIIMDAGFHSVPASVAGYLMTQGVKIKLYHPFSLSRLQWMTRRMHDKGLSIDGKKMIRGGRNVQDSYFGRAKTNFIDRDAYLEGQVVRESDAYFDKLWNSKEVAGIRTGNLGARHLAEGRRIMQEARIDMTRSKKWKLQTKTNWGRGLRDIGRIQFFHDPVGRKDLDPGTAEGLRDTLRMGRKSILIESPYLVPTPEFLREVRSAQERGVTSIEIVTNSAASVDGVFVFAGYDASRRKLSRMGVKLWEFKGPHTLHAKSAVIDDRHAIVGSFNLDPRSQRLNTETAVAAADRETALALKRAIDAHKETSWRIGPDGRPMGDPAGYPGVSMQKRVRMWMIRCVVPLIWNQI